MNQYTQTEDDVFEILLESPSTSSSPDLFELSEEDQTNLIPTIHDLVEEYIVDEILKISKPIFMTELVENIVHVLFQQLNDANIIENDQYNDIYPFIEEQCYEWFKKHPNCPLRHNPHTCENILVIEYAQDEDFVLQYLTNKLSQIREKDECNPQQRTPEWYKRRYNMLTASNLWQIFSSEAQRNRLICEKCKPLETNVIESKWINTDNSLQWGVRYEPLTVKVYEHITHAKLDFFGCIVHSKYHFLGASPDGIVVNPESSLYGRLVEIKNIYNREMDGIPSEAYWIQTQIQMECCDLDVCDFVETRFKEYESVDAFWAEEDTEKLRGVIIHFIPRDSLSNLPLYKYSEFQLSQHNMYEWIDQMKTEVADQFVLFKTYYWYLDDIQMTTIYRNDYWFKAAIPKIQEFWNTIQQERISGYEHRFSKKRSNVTKEILVIREGVEELSISPPKFPTAVCQIRLTEEELALP
jgi:putative phage-type endonuclease